MKIFGSVDLAEFGWTVQDAIKFALKYLRQQKNSALIQSAMDEMISLRAHSGRSHRYRLDLRVRLSRFADSFPRRTVASITAKDVDAFLAGLRNLRPGAHGAVSAGTRNTFRRDLITFFSFCEKRGYCSVNEAKKTEKARELVNKPIEILTPAQASALLASCDNETLPVVAISLFAGLRSAEVEKLDWSEIDLEGGHIEVKAEKAKTARRRLVPISPVLACWLLPFARAEGRVAPVGLRTRLEAARERAGFEKWPQNALRHSFGSYRLTLCQDAARVALEMGNSQAMVFAHYREVVKPKDAERFWALHESRNIRARRLSNVVAFAQAA